MRINTRQELEAKRKEYAASLKTQRKQILICAGTGCVAGGSLNIYARMQEILIKRGIKCSLVLEKEPHDESIGLKKSGCHGFCEMGPLLRIEPEGILYVKVQTKDCEEIIDKSIVADEILSASCTMTKRAKLMKSRMIFRSISSRPGWPWRTVEGLMRSPSKNT